MSTVTQSICCSRGVRNHRLSDETIRLSQAGNDFGFGLGRAHGEFSPFVSMAKKEWIQLARQAVGDRAAELGHDLFSFDDASKDEELAQSSTSLGDAQRHASIVNNLFTYFLF